MDGKITTHYSQGSCTHTVYANNAWWRVDLGLSLPVAEVVIVNRACSQECAGFLSAFEIRIGKILVTMKAKRNSCNVLFPKLRQLHSRLLGVNHIVNCILK